MNKNEDLVKNITKKVEQVLVLNNLVSDKDTIIVGVSGGPDSMCLLDLLYNLKDVIKADYNIEYSIVVAHVNHMIRKESIAEKEYVENFCKNKNIAFYYKEENVKENAKKMHMSQEAYGRKIRYDFFEEVRNKLNAQKIAVAHNLDDNVETILLNIIRGCGLKGLTGMSYTNNYIIRPLLDIEKKDILGYNICKNLNPCFDKTNELEIYTRNKIRLNLLPMLKNEYNSNIMENIIRMKHILELDEEFLNNYSKKVLDECIIENNNGKIKFDFSIILNQHRSIQNRVIRELIIIKNGNVESVENIHINDIIKLLTNNIKGKKYILGDKFNIEIIKKNIAIIN